MNDDDDLRAYSIAEFCRRFSVGPTRAYDLIRDGDLKASKLGKRTLIARDEAERWLNSLPPKKQSP